MPRAGVQWREDTKSLILLSQNHPKRNIAMRENSIAREVVDVSIDIHRQLGPGLFESVYEPILSHCLTQRGFSVERQVRVPIEFNGMRIEEGFRADLIIENLVIIELKSIE